MIKVGIIGWRGMVGSILIQRMIEKDDFNNFEPHFFSTSKNTKPNIEREIPKVKDANKIHNLIKMDIIVSCQGSIYTKQIHRKIRNSHWKGYWIDVASALRMEKNSIIVLDPVNKEIILNALSNGILNFIGGNCTVSLMLMAIHGLIENNWIDWISSMTYQSVSGAGIKKIKEMLLQMREISKKVEYLTENSASESLEIDLNIRELLFQNNFPKIPIATNIIPWIDKAMPNGQTREEWKGFAETNKIMGLDGENTIHVDGQCVRVSTIRCHSQALMIKLKKNIPLKEIETVIENSNKWIKLIKNDKQNTINYLNPISVSGSLNIHIGRLRKSNIGNKYVTAFTIGDQLLWGAAEPIRRTLKIILNHIS